MIRFFILFSLFTSILGAQPIDNKQFRKFLSILANVESGGKTNAVGDGGKAIGIYQIHYSYWKDATDFNKSIKGKYEDCFNLEYAGKIVNNYIVRYCKSNSYEDWARLHNGGWNYKNKTGKAKENLNNYWARFNKELNK